RSAYRLVAVTLLLGLAVSLKFSAAVFAAGAWLVVVGVWRSRRRADSTLSWKPVVGSAAVAGAIVVSWMMRGIVLSGYPIFPTPVGAAHVEWRAPLEHAEAEYAFIVHSTRMTALQLGEIPGLERAAVWFPRWLPRLVFEAPFDVLVPSIAAVAGLIAYGRL